MRTQRTFPVGKTAHYVRRSAQKKFALAHSWQLWVYFGQTVFPFSLKALKNRIKKLVLANILVHLQSRQIFILTIHKLIISPKFWARVCRKDHFILYLWSGLYCHFQGGFSSILTMGENWVWAVRCNLKRSTKDMGEHEKKKKKWVDFFFFFLNVPTLSR